MIRAQLYMELELISTRIWTGIDFFSLFIDQLIFLDLKYMPKDGKP